MQWLRSALLKFQPVEPCHLAHRTHHWVQKFGGWGGIVAASTTTPLMLNFQIRGEHHRPGRVAPCANSLVHSRAGAQDQTQAPTLCVGSGPQISSMPSSNLQGQNVTHHWFYSIYRESASLNSKKLILWTMSKRTMSNGAREGCRSNDCPPPGHSLQ